MRARLAVVCAATLLAACSIGGGRTELNVPDQMAIFAGEIYVADEGNHSVAVFPINASNDAAPARRFVGANTGLSSPLGAFVF